MIELPGWNIERGWGGQMAPDWGEESRDENDKLDDTASG